MSNPVNSSLNKKDGRISVFEMNIPHIKRSKLIISSLLIQMINNHKAAIKSIPINITGNPYNDFDKRSTLSPYYKKNKKRDEKIRSPIFTNKLIQERISLSPEISTLNFSHFKRELLNRTGKTYFAS